MKKLLLTGFALVSMASQAQSWVPQATKLPVSFAPREISIVDANVVWASVSDGSGAGTYPKSFIRTINGGTTWTPGNIAGPPAAALVGDIHAFDANTAWVATAPSTGTSGNGIYKTVNGGTTWTKQNVYSAVSFANCVYFWDANNGVTFGDPPTNATSKFEVYTTTNGGTTWTANPNGPNAVGGGYGLTGVKAVAGNSIWFGTTNGKIARSTDRGLTWNIYVSPALDFGSGGGPSSGGGQAGSFGHFSFKDPNNGILTTVDNAIAGQTPSAAIYSTTNGGVTWDPVTPTGPWYYGDITYVKGTANTYVSTGDATGNTGSSYSTNGGLNWTAIDNGEQRGTVQFLNPTTGWCGFFSDGPSGVEGIFKFSGTFLGVSTNAVKSSLKVFPNPAVDVVTVSANKEIKAVSVIDLSGKRVKAVQTSGEVNVSSLAKGTYVLQISYADGAVENTKLIKK